ncbi:hypothetical protein [Streptomyces violascens]|uniref:hypothetical protein n=1 Tax=Streptomyces violascens TaxID=67381 RepID=UPI0036C7BC09
MAVERVLTDGVEGAAEQESLERPLPRMRGVQQDAAAAADRPQLLIGDRQQLAADGRRQTADGSPARPASAWLSTTSMTVGVGS